MKTTIYFLFQIMLIVSGCGQKLPAGDEIAEKPAIDRASTVSGVGDKGYLLTLAQAEKILGEPAAITDSVINNKGDILSWSFTFKALSVDKKTGKTGALYFMQEEYKDTLASHKSYEFFKIANQDHGIEVLPDLGDEAYFHSDKQNFYFVLVRKGKKMMRMKVNKITGNTSLDEFNLAAGDITAKM